MENNYVEVAAVITTIGNTIFLIWQAWKRSRPEIEKLEAEGDSAVADAAHSIGEGALLNNQMLKQRIDELQSDLATEKKSRRDDAEYFRRRIKDIEKESRDYRLWSARLAKQVIELGKVPAPFISSLNDTDPLIIAITKEQAELEQAKDNRQAELKKEEKRDTKK